MSVANGPCARWIDLSDRQALGETLSPDEFAFVGSHAATCPDCRAEAVLWNDVESLVDGPAPGADERKSDVAPRRRANWPSIALAGSALALAAGAFFLLRDHVPEDVVATKAVAPAAAPKDAVVVLATTSGGPVEIDGRPGVVGQKLDRGAVLFARGGAACIAVEPTVRSCVTPGSLVRVADVGAHRRLELLGGKIAVELDPQAPGTSFGIVTRDGTAVAIGTAFSVEVPPGDAPVVTHVLHGKVVVRASNGAETRVGAHEMTSMEAPGPSTLPAAEEDRDRALLVAPTTSDDAAPVHIDSDTPGAVVTIDERFVGITPVAVLLPRGRHALSITGASGTTTRETLAVDAEPVARRFELPAAPAPSPGRAPPPETSAPNAAELLVAARESRARGDLADSVTAYRALFDHHRSSPEAHAALVPWGELQLSQLSDAAGALASFDRYLARGGPLEEEASFGRTRALRALGRPSEEREAIETFVKRFPESPIASSLRQRLQSLAVH